MSIFPTKVLLATDGSEDAQRAAQVATDITNTSGSELHVVYVDELLPRDLGQTEVEPSANPLRVFSYELGSAFASILVGLGVGVLVLAFDVLRSGEIHQLLAIIPAVIAAVGFDVGGRRRLPLSAGVEEAEARRRERGETQLEREAWDLLDQQVKRIEEAGGTVNEAHLRVGRADEEIVKVAEEVEAGLIVTGSRGRGRLRRTLVGSTADSVVRHAHSPVLVVRE